MNKITINSMRSYDHFISEFDSKKLIEDAIVHFEEGKNIIEIHNITYELLDDYHLCVVDDLKIMLMYCE